MNELAEPVGLTVLYYYPTEADALANSNELGSSDSLIGTLGGYTRWRIASNSAGSPYSFYTIYPSGYTLDASPITYYLYPAVIAYFPTEADALADTNRLGTSPSYVVGSGGPFGGYTSWRIASNSEGSSSQAVVYVNGDTLNSPNGYNLYPAAPCFLEGTEVLCQVDGVEKYVPVESLEKGSLVKTSLNGYKAVQVIGHGPLQNPGDDTRIENRLYKCSPSNYPELTADLYITGCHSILEFPLTEKQKEYTLKRLGKMYITDKKYRLMACDDQRAEPWNSEGTYNIYHFALENDNDGLNYGVYVNGGLLVETCAIRTLLNRTNMILK
jgi:hypothetical protein